MLYNISVTYKKLFLILAACALIKIFNAPIYNDEAKAQVLGANTFSAEPASSLKDKTTILTTTAFDQKEIVETVSIAYETRYEDDPEVEYGTEEVMQEGVEGKKNLKYLITYWQDDEIDRVLISTETEDPKEEIISKGTKIVWRDLPNGSVEFRGVKYSKYWYKLRVWATKYDGNCYGCSGRTFSGTSVAQGTCATDPKVISLGTNFYVEDVPGYGACRAEDTGGAIKGNRVDLGYEVASNHAWGAGYTDVYLLTSAPED